MKSKDNIFIVRIALFITLPETSVFCWVTQLVINSWLNKVPRHGKGLQNQRQHSRDGRYPCIYIKKKKTLEKNWTVVVNWNAIWTLLD